MASSSEVTFSDFGLKLSFVRRISNQGDSCERFASSMRVFILRPRLARELRRAVAILLGKPVFFQRPTSGLSLGGQTDAVVMTMIFTTQ